MRDVRLLEENLKKEYDVWLDSVCIAGGINFKEVVLKAIDEADVAIFPLHPGDLSHFKDENDFFCGKMQHAFEQHKKCLFVIFDSTSAQELVLDSLLKIDVCYQLRQILVTEAWIEVDMCHYESSMRLLLKGVEECIKQVCVKCAYMGVLNAKVSVGICKMFADIVV